jgi:Flp pilus assembly protein TadG
MGRYRSWPALGRRGTVAVLVGLAAPALTVTVALGVEVSSWTVMKQGLQRTADAAALAAAESFTRDPRSASTVTATVAAAEKTAETYGAFVAELNNAPGSVTRSFNATVHTFTDNTVTIAKVAGIVTSTDTAFVATATAAPSFLFSGYVLKGAFKSLSATATAEIKQSQFCVQTLDTTPATSVSNAGIDGLNGATLDLSQCGVQVNSTGVDALYLTGGASLLAKAVSVSGQINTNNGATITISSGGSQVTNAPTGVNPYAAVAIPAPGTCTTQSTTITASQTLNAGTFCGGLSISNGAAVTLNSGVYIMDHGNFSLQGGSLTGIGVTIVLTSSTGVYGTAQIANGVTLTLTAPASGALSGIAIIQDSRAPSTGSGSSVAGGAAMNITGALVFPSQIVSFSNGSSNASSCTQLIAYQVTFTGGAKFGNSCGGVGTSGIGSSSGPSLVQ